MHKLFVVGGNGFIGSHFIKYIIDKYPHYSCVNFDLSDRVPPILEGLKENPNYDFIHGTACEWELTKKAAIDCNAFINFADVSWVPSTEHNPVEHLVRNDYFAAQVLLEVSKYMRPSRFLQISTSEVYGEQAGEFAREEDRFMPDNKYAAVKAGADILASSYYLSDSIPVMNIRLSTVFGPYQDNRRPRQLLARYITAALADKPVRLPGDGQTRRDWLFVSDCCSAIDRILHYGTVGENYNVGSGQAKTDVSIARQVLKILEKPESLIILNPRLSEIAANPLIDTDKIKQIGWQPGLKLPQRIRQTVEWYQANKQFWQPTQKS